MTVNHPTPTRIPSRRNRTATMTGTNGVRPASMATDRDDSQDRIVCAVDFGTTFSGVATVYSANPEDLDIIKAS